MCLTQISGGQGLYIVNLCTSYKFTLICNMSLYMHICACTYSKYFLNRCLQTHRHFNFILSFSAPPEWAQIIFIWRQTGLCICKASLSAVNVHTWLSQIRFRYLLESAAVFVNLKFGRKQKKQTQLIFIKHKDFTTLIHNRDCMLYFINMQTWFSGV